MYMGLEILAARRIENSSLSFHISHFYRHPWEVISDTDCLLYRPIVSLLVKMASDEGIRTKRAVFVGGLAQTVNETTLLQAFSAFGIMYATNECLFSHEIAF